MDTEEVLRKLEFYTGAFPRQALQQAVASKEEITPSLLRIIEHANEVPAVLGDDNYMAHIYAMYLLAQFREKRAYPLIVEFFSIPGGVTVECTGDVVTEDLHRILASVSHGDASLIKRLAQNDNANEWVRGAALNALVTQVACGEAARDAVMAYYAELFHGDSRDGRRTPGTVW